MARPYNDRFWSTLFASALKVSFAFSVADKLHFARRYSWSRTSVGYWINGRNLPSHEALRDLKEYFYGIEAQRDEIEMLKNITRIAFESRGIGYVHELLFLSQSHAGQQISNTLGILYDLSKGRRDIIESLNASPSSGAIRAVVFDFDGTLTSRSEAPTTWEKLWQICGYSVEECQELHRQFDRKEITHQEWCDITLSHFSSANSHREQVEEIARHITLLAGTERTLEELEAQGVTSSIVSGSIGDVVRAALGPLCKYFREVRANEFKYSRKGYLIDIVGTKYDFEGKAAFISRIANDQRISPRDILFVGNSINDRFAYLSGAQTLCLNPRLVDIADPAVWNDCIETCTDLRQILRFVR